MNSKSLLYIVIILERNGWIQHRRSGENINISLSKTQKMNRMNDKHTNKKECDRNTAFEYDVLEKMKIIDKAFNLPSTKTTSSIF